MSARKINYAVDVAFQVISECQDEPTIQEMINAMEVRLAYLKEHKDEAREAFGVFDSYIVE